MKLKINAARQRPAIASAVAAVLGLTTAPAAPAQQVEEEAQGLEEVIVTARRVEENLQQTPIAVTVLTGDALDDRQISSTDVLDSVVPNLQFANNAPLAGNNSSSQVFIRGIGQTDPTSTVDPGVGLYIDDVYIGNAVGASMALRDVANVQVLRGPQGTLFGRNTIGGAVLITSNAPGEESGGDVRLEVGADSLLDGFLAFDVPFSDNLRTRWSAAVRQRDGYVTRPDGTDLGDTNVLSAATKWLWQPGEKFELAFAADYTTADENGSPLVFAAINESATFPRVSSQEAGCPGVVFPTSGPVPQIDDPRCANDFQGAGPYRNNGSLPLSSTLDNWGASLKLTYDVSDALQFKSITAYRDTRWTGARDADNTPLPILHTVYDVEGDQLSQELQLNYQTDTQVLVVGLYYFEQSSTDIADVFLNPPPPGVQHDSDNNIVDNSSWAAFSQYTYRFAERFGLTVGARYTEDRKGSYPDQFDYSNVNVKQLPVQWYRDTFDSLTPSASFSVEWTPKAMTYVSYSEGFKGGGWNSHFNAVMTPQQLAALHEFQQEEAKTVEVGAKFDLARDTLRLNLAAFTSDYTDMQITYRGPAPAGVAPFITNAGEASIDGAELELTWAPVDALRIETSLGYLDASIDSLANIPLAVLPPGLQAGNALPFAPEWTGHVGLAYTAHAGRFAIQPRVDVSYQSETFFDATNTPEIAQLDDVTTVNALLQIRDEDAKWKVNVGLNNATDETYPIAGNSSLTTGSGYAEIAYSRPREWFVSFEYGF